MIGPDTTPADILRAAVASYDAGEWASRIDHDDPAALCEFIADARELLKRMDDRRRCLDCGGIEHPNLHCDTPRTAEDGKPQAMILTMPGSSTPQALGELFGKLSQMAREGHLPGGAFVLAGVKGTLTFCTTRRD